MSPVIIALLVLLGVGLLLALWLMYIYNGLVVAGNRFKNAFAQIDVQLKRRYELIPNLVEDRIPGGDHLCQDFVHVLLATILVPNYKQLHVMSVRER